MRPLAASLLLLTACAPRARYRPPPPPLPLDEVEQELATARIFRAPAVDPSRYHLGGNPALQLRRDFHAELERSQLEVR